MTRKKILLVDDSMTALMMEKALLSRHAYDVVVARDGVEAVHSALESAPDLIVLDVIMPRMNGFEACRELRRLEATRGIPIVMVTTRGEPEHIAHGYEAGCNDYVTKPINGPELVAKIRDFLGE